MPTPPVTGPLVTRASLADDLRALGVKEGETLLVHSSLSSLGWVNGGAPAVVQALLDALGPAGTLTVPTQSGDLTDPAHWQSPPVPESWWDEIRATMPPYNPRTTPTRGMGAVPEAVRTWPGALRSAHPHTSFAAVGPHAAHLTADHALDCQLGERSPLARLESLDARVLLLGTGFDSCTAFHLAEYRVPAPLTTHGHPTPEGWRAYTDVALDSDDFATLGHDYERARPVTRGKAGAAPSRLFPVRDAVAYAEHWLKLHRPPSAPPSGSAPTHESCEKY